MNKRASTIVEVICHVLFWVVPTHLIIRYNMMSYAELTGVYYRMPLIISVLINIFLVYTNIFVLFPSYSRKRIKLLTYVLILAIMVAVLAIVKVKVDSSYMMRYFSRIVSEEHGRIWIGVIVNSFFAVQSVLYCIVREWIINRRNERILREEKLTLELKYLKSQINPHFLYNTLNNLYSVALKNNDNETAKGITKLSQMMRFMLDGVNENLIPLEKEITYLTSYLDLQKLRFSEQDDVKINFNIKGDITGIRIPPFIFIVFIENAFKYGVDYKKYSFVDIKFEVSDNILRFNIRNTIHKTGDLQNPGIGLKNIRGRLDLSYPGSYNLEIATENDIFNLELIIRLSQNQ